jgi:hypothetical protein
LFRWTAEELKKVIEMLKRPEFDSKEVDPDLHKRMNKAVEDGRIKCFNMRESNLDGDQDLNLWIREVEDIVREIMEDPIFKGNQNYKFEMDLDEAGKRLFGGEANAGVAFQIGQLRYKQLFFKYILVCTSTYMYILVHTSTYQYILVHTSMYWLDLTRCCFSELNTVLAGLGMEQFPLQLLCTLMVALSSTRFP